MGSLVVSGLVRPPSVMDLRGAGAADLLLTCPGYVAVDPSLEPECRAAPAVSPLASLSRSFASFEIFPGGGLLVRRPPLPLELLCSSVLRSLSFSLGLATLFGNPFSSLFFLTSPAAPPRTVVALWSMEILPDLPLLELILELEGVEACEDVVVS